ncbi:calcium-binding protein [Paracoccus sp. ME4]|uniref:calcium-binding protein n=1 Tax=Paracoccus sp. ME4 TaxID=3138066 RepID=UPI00398A8E6C
MVHLHAVDYDQSTLHYLLHYAWRWPGDSLVRGQPGTGGPHADHLTIFDSEWKTFKVDVFGDGLVTDDRLSLTDGRIGRIDLSEGFRFSPFLPAGSHELRLSLDGLSLTPAVLRRVYDTPDIRDDAAFVARIFAGNDLLEVTGSSRVSGHAGHDTIRAGDGDDTLQGGAGNDRVNAGGGDDIVYLDAGNDHLIGGPGRDVLVVRSAVGMGIDLAAGTVQGAGLGRDTITGFEIVRGNEGFDRIGGDARADTLMGMGGNDTLSGRDGNDVIRGGAGKDILQGGAGDDLLFGGDDNDILSGGGGTDDLYGDAGDDLLRAGSGRADLYGGSGADTLLAGADAFADNLHGGAGPDVFLFRARGPAERGYATAIWDFRPGQDRIDISALDADPRHPGNDAFRFLSDGVLPARPGGQIAIRQETDVGVNHTIVLIDMDGDAEPEMIIDVLGHVTLTEQDFIL